MPLGSRQNNNFLHLIMDVWRDQIFFNETVYPTGHFAAELLNVPEETMRELVTHGGAISHQVKALALVGRSEFIKLLDGTRTSLEKLLDALWLSVMVAKGELVWGMSVKQGTTLYLCLEDSVLRIQNRLFEITEDAPSSVHFCTECDLIGQGLEEQVETFLTAHPDTVLVIIDTLQMVRPARDATYANDYRDLSALKRIADAHGIAILLIHHLRKETADDVFNRISGTTAISGAVDSSFTLVEERRGSGRAKLSCIGRDIEYRELTLERNGENVWELVSDSRTQPELLGDRIVYLLSELMRDRTEFIGTPTELSERIDPVGAERISPKKVSRQILQNLDALSKIGISAVVRRSNGKRLIGLRRAGSDDTQGVPAVDPVDPAGALCGDLRAISEYGE